MPYVIFLLNDFFIGVLSLFLLLQVSVGTLLAFTMVAVSVLILRYVPPDEVPLPSSLQAAIDSVSLRYSNTVSSEDVEVDIGQSGVSG